MAEFLPGVGAVIFEKADIFDARVALEIEDAFGGQTQELPDLFVAGLPQMPVVSGILDQHFMRAHRAHAVVNAIAAAAGLAFNVVERRGMHHGARRPVRRAGYRGDDLRGIPANPGKSGRRFPDAERLRPGHLR